MKRLRVAMLLLAFCLALSACGAREAEKMDFTLEINGDKINGSYTGPLKKGLPEGDGIFKSKDFSYKGKFEGGLPAGSGNVKEMDYKLILDGESYKGLYEGEVQDGLPSGNGNFLENPRKGELFYEGGWEEGIPEGSGTASQLPVTLEYSGSSYSGIYSGEVRDGNPGGEGSFSGSGDPGTLTYEGSWAKGQPAAGTISCPSYVLSYHGSSLPGVYSGSIQDGLPQGEGVFDYTSGHDYMRYTGGWEAGVMAGAGEIASNIFVMTVTNNTVTEDRIGNYEGETLDGLASGSGVFATQNPQGTAYSYTGEFQNNLYHGQGNRVVEGTPPLEYPGTYIEGEYCPTPYELLLCLSGDPTMSFTMAPKAVEILQNHPEVFLEHSFGSSGLSEAASFSYGEFKKNPLAFDGCFFTRQNMKVLQIRESDASWDSSPYTYVFLTNADGSKLYNVYLMGHFEHIQEGSTVTLTALALDYAPYDDVSADKTWAMLCAGVNMIPS